MIFNIRVFFIIINWEYNDGIINNSIFLLIFFRNQGLKHNFTRIG